MRKFRRLSFISILALPWIWPIAFGPWAEAMPWLFSLGVSSAVIALWRSDENIVYDVAWSFSLASIISVIPVLIQYLGYSELDFFWPWIRASTKGVAIGNIGQPNQQATLFVISIISIYWLCTEGKISKLCCIALSFFVLIGLALTASRTGMLNFIFIFFILFWISSNEKKFFFNYFVACIIFYIISIFAFYELAILLGVENPRNIFFRIKGPEGGSCHSRLLLWGNVIDIIKLRPWQGWGWDSLRYAQYVTDFSGDRWCEVLGNAHNLPLHLAATLGIPAAAIIFTICFFVIIKTKPWAESGGNKKFLWAILIPILIHSMLEFPLWYGPFQLIFGISIYLIFVDKKIVFNKHLKYIFSGVFFIFSVWGFFDYWRVTQVYLPPELRVAELQSDFSLKKTLVYSSKTVFFSNQSKFATVAFVSPDKENAVIVNKMANELLHFSAEPKIIKKILESSMLIGNNEQFDYHKKRFQIAYPKEFSDWHKENKFQFN